MSLIEFDGVWRSFVSEGDRCVDALRGVSFAVCDGEFVCFTGSSGSGKTTLLNVLGCLDRMSAGSYKLAGREIQGLGPDGFARLRRRVFGIVLQHHNLLESVTALENVELAGAYAGVPRAARRERAIELLAELGLGGRVEHLPSNLSGGEQQRVAIARALMNDSRIILADEPTGALDTKSTGQVLDALERIVDSGRTVVLATHSAEVAARAFRRFELQAGRVIGDSGGAVPHYRNGAETRSEVEGGAATFLDVVEVGFMAIRAHLRRGNRLRAAICALSVSLCVWLGGMSLMLGDGLYARTVDAVNATGLETITVMPNETPDEYNGSFAGLTLDDAIAIRNGIANVQAVSPMKFRHFVNVRRGDYAGEFTVVGAVDQGTKEGRGHRAYRMAAGEFVSAADDAALRRVAVLDAVALERLFPADIDPLGKEIYIDGIPFQVKGMYEYRTGEVLRTPGQSEAHFLEMEERTNSRIYIPFRTFYAQLATHEWLFCIDVFLESTDELFAAANAIRRLGILRHGADVYFVEHPGQALEEAKRLRNRLRLGLGTMAGVILLSASLGVMAVMFLAVRARRREIGIRMATGAGPRDIFWQFLSETVAYGIVGGVLGVLASLACVPIMNALGYPIGFPSLIWVPLAGAVLLGLGAGIWPARRAAQLAPYFAIAEN